MEQDAFDIYSAVVNHEEQYSIWPVAKPLPPGWKETGVRGSRQECLDHIEKIWTDMRPLSLRRAMEAAETNPPNVSAEAAPVMHAESLPARLCQTEQPVEVCLRPERTAAALRQCIQRGFVKLKFTNTEGGTEIGFRLEPNAVALTGADFERAVGSITLEARTNIDFVPLSCRATISLATLNGSAVVATN